MVHLFDDNDHEVQYSRDQEGGDFLDEAADTGDEDSVPTYSTELKWKLVSR